MAKTKKVHKRRATSPASSQDNRPHKTHKQDDASSGSGIQMIPSQHLKRHMKRQRANLKREEAVVQEEGDDRSVGQLAQAQEEAAEDAEQDAPEQVNPEQDHRESFHTSYGGNSTQERNQRVQGWINNISNPQDNTEAKHAEHIGSQRRSTKSRAAKEADDSDKMPEQFLCQFHGDLIMRDPVYLPTSGKTVDRTTITEHLQTMSHDPFNGRPLKIEDVVPNRGLRNLIAMYLASKEGSTTGGSRRNLFQESMPVKTPCPEKVQRQEDVVGSDESDGGLYMTSENKSPPKKRRKATANRSRIPVDSDNDGLYVTSEGSASPKNARKATGRKVTNPKDNKKSFLGGGRGLVPSQSMYSNMYPQGLDRFHDKGFAERRDSGYALVAEISYHIPREGASHVDRDYFPNIKYNLDYDALRNELSSSELSFTCHNSVCDCSHHGFSHVDRDYFPNTKYKLDYGGSRNEVPNSEISSSCDNSVCDCPRCCRHHPDDGESEEENYDDSDNNDDEVLSNHCSLCENLAADDGINRCLWLDCLCHRTQEAYNALPEGIDQASSCGWPGCDDCYPENLYEKSSPSVENEPKRYHDRDAAPLQASYIASFPEAYRKRKMRYYGLDDRDDTDFFLQHAEYLDYGEEAQPIGGIGRDARVAAEESKGGDDARIASSVDYERNATGGGCETIDSKPEYKGPKDEPEEDRKPALTNNLSEAKKESDILRSISSRAQSQRRRTVAAPKPRAGHPGVSFSGLVGRQTATAARVRSAPLGPGQGFVSISIAEQQQAQMFVGLSGGGSVDADEE